METIDEVIARAMERGARAGACEPMAISARFDATARRLFRSKGPIKGARSKGPGSNFRKVGAGETAIEKASKGLGSN